MKTVTVTVDSSGNPSANPDNLKVYHGPPPRGDGTNVPVKWTIATPNYVFPATGALQWTGGDGSQFDALYTLTENNTVMTVDDANSALGTWPYTLTVNPVNGGPSISFDPAITNENPSEPPR